MDFREVIVKMRWLPTIIVAAAIAWLTLAPHPLPDNNIEWFAGADKMVHFIMFATLMGTVVFGLHWSCPSTVSKTNRENRRTNAKLLAGGLCVTLFAALDEWAQGAMQMGRSAEFKDFIADLAGISIICLIRYCYRFSR